ncbi:hypothetical protein [Clostridium pasteurianum]|uniref:Uncharacterized protein n=1 Tax=Clostridium pasteurianum BC1 TaxID=86416 RepID=R4K8H7_CLOPA|nr:hypothetical protein [Clostridium pasteurianum]AGK96839.1 hypothetical protein Clopa_1944 [Clostridium pasteurianum BC1]
MNNLLKNRIFKYLIYFIFLCTSIYGIDYFFRPQHKDFIRTASISFGVTIGMFIVSRRKKL